MQKIQISALALAGGLFLFSHSVYASTLQEDFSSSPAAQGWQVFGNTNQFTWNPSTQNLSVTWDSSQANSYFYHPLGTVLTRDDDFSMSFDLRLNDILPGANTNKSGAFELAIGLLNFGQASATNFFRGSGTGSPNLVEFDYFADAGFGATIWPVFISTNSSFNYNGSTDYTLLGLSTNDWFSVSMVYSASNATLTTTMTKNGSAFGPINSVMLSTNFTDFRVDTFALSSYSDTGDDYDSLLAHGQVDNIVIVTPPPPVTALNGRLATQNIWEMQFVSRSNWVYTLERTADFSTWTPVSARTGGNGAGLVLQDPQASPASGFYRVRAERQ